MHQMTSSLMPFLSRHRRPLLLGLVILMTTLMMLNFNMDMGDPNEEINVGFVVPSKAAIRNKIAKARSSKLRRFPAKMTTLDQVIDPKHPKKMLVVVLTTESMFNTRGKAVRDTWMDYANNKHPELGVHVVMAFDGKPTKEHEGVPMIPSRKTNYDDLYLKVFDTFETVWELFGEDYDYFMKADDDVFVHIDRVAERFKKVEVYNPAVSQMFGFRGPGDFMCWGGPGYAMSRQALREIYPHMNQCKDFVLPEDISMAWCFMRHSFNYHKKIWLGCQPLENNDHTGFCHIPPEQKDNWALWNQPDKEFPIDGTWISNWRFSTVLTMHAFKTELNSQPTMREYYNHFYNNNNNNNNDHY